MNNPSEDLRRKRSFLEKRAAILRAVRDHFDSAGFLEVETPLRIPAPAPEFHIDAEPSGDHYLITSPELQMKRMLAAGYERIYQIVHCFRRGERGERHLPEFTMIEWYRADAGIDHLMRDCEQLIAAAARAVNVFPRIEYDRQTIDLAAPYPATTVADAFEQHAGWRPGPDPDPDRFDLDLVDKVEPALIGPRPVFLTHYPRSMASLARLDPQNPEVALRFELYAGGLELANGFDELTDPALQRARFKKEKAHRAAAGKSDYPLDDQFLEALEDGMPRSAGIAFGIDRLVMLLTGTRSIDDVVAFPAPLQPSLLFFE